MNGEKLPEGAYDVLIIGGGPGGLTAGLYAARANFRTLLVESGMVMSQITVTHLVENYPGVPDIGGYELVEKFKEQAKKFGLQTAYAAVAGLEKATLSGMPGWKVKTDAGDFEALSVIVATGPTGARSASPARPSSRAGASPTAPPVTGPSSATGRSSSSAAETRPSRRPSS